MTAVASGPAARWIARVGACVCGWELLRAIVHACIETDTHRDVRFGGKGVPDRPGVACVGRVGSRRLHHGEGSQHFP